MALYVRSPCPWCSNARSDLKSGRDAVLRSVFNDDLRNAPRRLVEFLLRVGVQTEFAAYGVTDYDSRRMVAQAMEGVRGKNFIGALC